MAAWIGSITDQFDFNFSEYLYILLTLMLSVYVFRGAWLIFRKEYLLKKRLLIALLHPGGLSAILLLIGISAQNALPPVLIPAWYMARSWESLGKDYPKKISFSGMEELTRKAAVKIQNSLQKKEYQSLTDDQILKAANKNVAMVLKKLGHQPARKVQKIKKLTGFTRLIGFAYGGPAYHDWFTQEVVMPEPEDFPAAKAWRIMGIFHEVGHAMGYIDDIDNTIVTYLAMTRCGIGSIRASGYFLWMRYTPFWPEHVNKLADMGVPMWFLKDYIEGLHRVNARMSKQKLIQKAKTAMKTARIQNNQKKYGLEPQKFSTSPFYRAILGFEKISFAGRSLFD